MNKTELSQRVAKRTNMSENMAGQLVSTTFQAIQTALMKGEKVSLVGFGTFEVVPRAARSGRNPQTGGEITIPASKQPKFRPGKTLKEALV